MVTGRCILIVLAALVVSNEASGQTFDALISPGPLSRAHSELTGLGNCSSCHTPGQGVQDNKCLECHKEMAVRIQAGKGFHRDKDGDCWACHTEHEGVDVELTPLDVSSFDHRETGYALVGLHLEVGSCEQCHTPGNSPPREKTRTFLMNDSRCVSCHRDEHRGQLGENCLRCHSVEVKFADVPFDHHQTRFALLGAHTRVDCRQCHVDGQWKGLRFSSCTDCHTDQHRPSLGADCERCHNSRDWRISTFDHDRTRYPLLGMHRKVGCDDCHESQQFKGVAFNKCDDCHRKDPHWGQFTEDCSHCHRVEGFKPTLFNHEQSSYTLEGRHTSLTCTKCHGLEEGSFPAGIAKAIRYKPLPSACAGCHDDVHLGQLATNCNDCHTVNGFDDGFLEFQHDRDSRYKLLGKHTTLECSECHKLDQGSFPTGTGRAVRYRPISHTCITCHTDVHRSSRSGASRHEDDTQCLRCHTNDTFVLTSFDHGVTSFPLDGRHGSLTCDRCHERVAWNGREILAFRELEQDCADCHRSPHSSRQKRCTECHTTKNWDVRPW